MRVTVLGGTIFIGRAIVGELSARGHDVLVVHRGEHEPTDGFPDVEHLHADRARLADHAGALAAFEPDAVVDARALGASDVDGVLAALPRGPRLVVLSSVDVYRAYASMSAGVVTDVLPIDEGSPVREERYPYRGVIPNMDDYEKLDCEERYLDRAGTVLRLPFVIGPHDYQRREEFVLRRVRAGRRRMPFGAGTFLKSMVHVEDVARGVAEVVAAEPGVVEGEVFNLTEARASTVRQWAELIVAAAGAELELVTVADDAVPADLGLTRAIPQHLLVSSEKARSRLDWSPLDHDDAVRRSVEWHLAHPPPAGTDDEEDAFAADDEALATVAS